jgi:2-iminobutanoate/2-iminopropanoate deaminase
MRTALKGSLPSGSYSPGILANGSYLFISGQGPLRDGRPIAGSIAEETRLALENVGRVLSEADLTFDDVVRCGVFLSDVGDFQAMDEVYRSYFSEPRPARTTVGVTLPYGIKVEIDCIAVVAELQTPSWEAGSENSLEVAHHPGDLK